MRIVADRKALLAAVTPAAKIIDPRSTIPILGHLLLEAAEGLTVTGDSMDIRIATTLAADVDRPGRITVDGKVLAQIVRSLAEGVRVTIDVAEDGRATLSAGRSRFKLPTFDPADFPDTRRQEWAAVFSLPAVELKRMLEQAAPFMDRSGGRHYLEGVSLQRAEAADPDGAVLRAYATNGHQLIRHERPLPEGAEAMPAVILPDKSCAEIARLAVEGEVQLQVGDRMVAFGFPSGLTLTTKVIDGTFPDCERVIPRGNTKRATVDRAAILEALERVTAVAEKDRRTKLTFADGHLRLEIASVEKGEAAEEIEVEGDVALVTGFSAQYLKETLGALDGDRIVAMLEDTGSPALFSGFERPSPLCVVMPMRV